MKTIDLNTWHRKQSFQHFNALANAYFRGIFPFDVTEAYDFAKRETERFFAKCLNNCLKAIKSLENLRYSIANKQRVDCVVIHALALLWSTNKTFGFSFSSYNDLDASNSEKNRIEQSNDLYPQQNGLNCAHCLAMLWFKFSRQIEPVSNEKESVPKLVFYKGEKVEKQSVISVSMGINPALVEGGYMGVFPNAFQEFLNAKGHKFD